MSEANPRHAAHNLRRVGTTLRRNRASTATEALTALAEGFRYADHAGTTWQADEQSLLAGSPVWDQARPTQRRALNHLWWVAFYQLISAAEAHTIDLNQRCAAAFFPLRGYEEVCLELDLETSQERHHIQAFRLVSERTEDALLGRALFVRPTGERRDALPSRVGQASAGLRRAALRGAGTLHGARVARSPFLASQYFLLRGLFNIVAKHKEGSAFKRASDAHARGEAAPAPTEIVHHHYIDEGYHMAISQLLAHEIYRDFPRPSAVEAWLMAELVRGVCRLFTRHLGALMGGSIGDDGAALPIFYDLLRGAPFGLAAGEARALLRQSYCEEHEGFHSSARFRQRFLTAARQSLSDIEYLPAAVRELRVPDASMGEVLARNRKTFADFERGLGADR